MQHTGLPARFRYVNFESIYEGQTQKFFVELARLFGVATAVRVMVQTIDH
jgi:hypothetical protein